jgi:hypothetical protein
MKMRYIVGLALLVSSQLAFGEEGKMVEVDMDCSALVSPPMVGLVKVGKDFLTFRQNAWLKLPEGHTMRGRFNDKDVTWTLKKDSQADSFLNASVVDDLQTKDKTTLAKQAKFAIDVKIINKELVGIITQDVAVSCNSQELILMSGARVTAAPPWDLRFAVTAGDLKNREGKAVYVIQAGKIVAAPDGNGPG